MYLCSQSPFTCIPCNLAWSESCVSLGIPSGSTYHQSSLYYSQHDIPLFSPMNAILLSCYPARAVSLNKTYSSGGTGKILFLPDFLLHKAQTSEYCILSVYLFLADYVLSFALSHFQSFPIKKKYSPCGLEIEKEKSFLRSSLLFMVPEHLHLRNAELWLLS